MSERPPQTRFARSGDVGVAYQVLGEGHSDLVYVPAMAHHVELAWELRPHAAFFRRLATLGRLLLFDKRGTGMSGRVAGLPTLESRMDDIRAVMDAAESERAVIYGSWDGAALAALFAATYPERTTALVLFNPAPRFVRSPELSWLPTRIEYERQGNEAVRHWGDPDWLVERYWSLLLPSATLEEVRGYGRMVRFSLDPDSYAAYRRMNLDLDVSGVLSLIRVPTLVMSRTQVERCDIRTARFVAAQIPGARLVEMPGRDLGAPYGDPEAVISELKAFLAKIAEMESWQVPDRVLATVLFTDLVGATVKAVELGPRWAKLLGDHNTVINRELLRFRGRTIDTAGDGFFASGFDGPARAIRCACSIRDAITDLGLAIRVGVHTGECDLVDQKLSGLAVHIGARVAAQADAGEVLVSGTVKDLVAGSGINFEPRGVRELKGVGEWPLYAVTSMDEESIVM